MVLGHQWQVGCKRLLPDDAVDDRLHGRDRR